MGSAHERRIGGNSSSSPPMEAGGPTGQLLREVLDLADQLVSQISDKDVEASYDELLRRAGMVRRPKTGDPVAPAMLDAEDLAADMLVERWTSNIENTEDAPAAHDHSAQAGLRLAECPPSMWAGGVQMQYIVTMNEDGSVSLIFNGGHAELASRDVVAVTLRALLGSVSDGR